MCAEHARWFPHTTSGVWPEPYCEHPKCGLAVDRGPERGALVSRCGWFCEDPKNRKRGADGLYPKAPNPRRGKKNGPQRVWPTYGLDMPVDEKPKHAPSAASVEKAFMKAAVAHLKAEFPSMGAKMIFATCDAKWLIAPENPANAEKPENA